MKPRWIVGVASAALAAAVIACGSDGSQSLLPADRSGPGGSGGADVSTDGGPVPGQPATLEDGGINPLYCPTGLSECNGACVDLTKDTANCGSCGATCDGTCTASRCIVSLGSGGSGQAIAVSSANVYFAGSAGLLSVPLAGGKVTTVASGANGAVAVDAKNVYFATPQGVKSIPLAGGDPTRLGRDAAEGITSNGQGVCWTDINGDIVSVPVPAVSAAGVVDDGGAGDGGLGDGAGPVPRATTLAQSSDNPTGIVASASALYWTTSGTVASGGGFTPLSGSIMRFAFSDFPEDGGVPADGGVTTIASSQNYPLAIAVDANNVYWTASGTTANSFADGAVMKAPAAGGAPVTIAAAQAFPYGIAVDGTNVYWANSGSNGSAGTIMSAPIAGGAPVTIASGLTGPTYVAVDGTSVYWTTSGGAVMKATPK
jgi:hypothetical protein